MFKAKQATCKHCGQVFQSGYARTKHIQASHPDKVRHIKPKQATTLTPLDRILAAKQEIRKAMADLDVERTQLMERIKMIDTQIASYKEFTAQ